jgi:hypothetical protein
LADALADFLAAGFFVAVVFVVIFAVMIVLRFWRFAAPPAETRRISGVATGHHAPCGRENSQRGGRD